MTKSEDQIREIVREALAELIDEHTIDGGLVRWLDSRCGDYLSREEIDRVADAATDAKVSVTW